MSGFDRWNDCCWECCECLKPFLVFVANVRLMKSDRLKCGNVSTVITTKCGILFEAFHLELGDVANLTLTPTVLHV